jgi:hypothetical protein
MSIRAALLLGAACLCMLPTAVAAQVQDNPPVESLNRGLVMPDASFGATFRKYTPPANDFAPVFSWDAAMALNLTVLRAGASSMNFRSTFQTAGTENVRSQVSVGGTGYLLSIGYLNMRSPDLMLSAGLVHMSSHLTRDLDEKLKELAREGTAVPSVEDPSEYNTFYFGAYKRMPSWRFTPEFEIVVEPTNFSFNGAPAGYVRPLYLGSRWTLWHGTQTSLVARTQHEIGENPLNYFSLSLAMLQRSNQPEGRFQIFVGASPGRGMHVSPNLGALRDGIGLGLRLAFRA